MKKLLKKSITWLMILLLSVGTIGTFLPGTSAEAEAAETESPKYMAKITARSSSYNDSRLGQFINVEKGTTYTLSFKLYVIEQGTIIGWNRELNIGTKLVQDHQTAVGTIKTVKHEAKYTPIEDEVAYINIQCETGAFYIWDVKFTAEGSEENLFKNANFEDGDGSFKEWYYSGYNGGSYKQMITQEDFATFENNTGRKVVPYAATWSAQATLEDSIDFTYKTALTVPVYGNQTPTMKFEMLDGSSKVIKTKEVTGTANADGTYSFTYDDMLPQQMAYDITATLTVPAKSGSFTQTKTFSMKEYCKAILEDTGSATQLKNLVADLLRYGAEVQKKYGLSDSITTGLTLTGLGSSNDLNSINSYVSQILSGTQTGNYKWKSASLVLDGRVTVRLKFTADDTTNLTVKVNDKEYPVQSLNNGNYYVDIPMAAVDFDKELCAKFYLDGTVTGVTLNYSVNTYLYNKRNAITESDLLKSIYAYGISAESYWIYKNPVTTLGLDNEYADNWEL